MSHKPIITSAAGNNDITKNYNYYQKLVVFLERLKREKDLEMGPRLLNKIIDAQREGFLTSEQVLELSGRIQRWLEKRQEFFSSQEFQMKKMLKAMENEDRRSKKKTVPQNIKK